MKEEWRDIAGGLFKVSGTGRVKSFLNGEPVRIENARHLFDDLFRNLEAQENGDYIITEGDYRIVAEEEPEYMPEKK